MHLINMTSQPGLAGCVMLYWSCGAAWTGSIIELDSEIEKYAIAAGKNNKNLIKDVNEALAEIKTEGIYDELIIKHFN